MQFSLELISKIETINSEVDKSNEVSKQKKWKRESLLTELTKDIEEYNEVNGTELSLKNPNSIVEEANRVLKTKITEYKTIEKALQLIEEKDFDKVQQLLGVTVDKGEEIKFTTDLVAIEVIEKDVELALEDFKFEETEESTSSEVKEEQLDLDTLDLSTTEEEDAPTFEDEEETGEEENYDDIRSSLLEGADVGEETTLEVDLDGLTETEEEDDSLVVDLEEEKDEEISLDLGTDEDEAKETEDTLEDLSEDLSLDFEEEVEEEKETNFLEGITGTDLSLDEFNV